MNDMVSQVVQVLDEGNPFISSNLDASQKHKERDRKRAKDQHQKASLKWDNGAKRWLVRKQEHDEILRETQHLNEISLRTIGIGVSMGLVKRWSSKATQEINKLKSLATRLKTAPDECRCNGI